jgi:hypothetical protein
MTRARVSLTFHVAVVLLLCLAAACASGRVRGAQGTEAGQAREYEPETKVDPPIGNVERTSGSMTQPKPYPVLEVDLERRREPPPSPEPEPEPAKKPED